LSPCKSKGRGYPLSIASLSGEIGISGLPPYKSKGSADIRARIRSLWQRLTSDSLYKGESKAARVTWFLEVEDDGALRVFDKVVCSWSWKRPGCGPRLRAVPVSPPLPCSGRKGLLPGVLGPVPPGSQLWKKAHSC